MSKEQQPPEIQIDDVKMELGEQQLMIMQLKRQIRAMAMEIERLNKTINTEE